MHHVNAELLILVFVGAFVLFLLHGQLGALINSFVRQAGRQDLCGELLIPL